VGSIAIADENTLLVERTFSGPMRHSIEIFPSVRDLLAQVHATPDDLKHVYVSGGPGSFTGLRIAVAIAKAMHLANAVRIVAVDTLDVIAANVPAINGAPEIIAPILDAKRNRFFAAVYERQLGLGTDLPVTAGSALHAAQPGWVKILPDTIITAEQILHQFTGHGRTLGILGDGLLLHGDRFKADGTRIMDQVYWSPIAANVYRLGLQKALLGQFEDPLRLAPFYLMPPEVTLH